MKIDVKNLAVESVQDKSSSKNIGLNLNGSSGGKNSSGSGGAGLNYSNYDKKWVENQSSIIGVKKSEIKVAENTNLAGGLLGGGNTALDTGTLTYSNIRDKEKGIDIGISGSVSENKKAGRTGNKTNAEGSYGAVDREQVTNATIGNGTIIVGGKEKNPDINRDESKGQEITKDININTIKAKYSSDSREWDEVPSIMKEHAESAIVDPLLDVEEKIDLAFTDKKVDIYKFNAEKDNEGKLNLDPKDPSSIHSTKIELGDKISEDAIIGITGINTNLDAGKGTVLQQGLMIKKKDSTLMSLKKGEKQELVLLHNKTHGFLGDILESSIDKFGGDGIYSQAAKSTGNTLWEYRTQKNRVVAHSQGTLLTKKGLEYIVDTYGDNALSQLKYSKITLTGAAANVENFKNYAEKHGFKGTIEVKNDRYDPVSSVIGWNPKTVDTDDEIKGSKNPLEYHSQYSEGQKEFPKEEKTTLQNGGDYINKGLSFMNLPDTMQLLWNKLNEEESKNEK